VPERVRILRVIARMNVGGPARIVADLMEDLDPDRYEQRLLIGRVGDDEADELDLRPRSFPVTRIDGLGRAPSVLADPLAVARVTSEIRSFRPHVVETHTAKAGVVGRLAAVAGRAPATVHVFHGHILHGYFSPTVTRAVVTTERLLARRTTRLVSVGAHVRDELLAAGIGRADQYAVIAPGVDIGPGPDRADARRQLGLEPDGVVVAFVGRLAGVKRPDRFARVAERVAAERAEVSFVIAGDGSGADALRATIDASPNLRTRTRLLGWYPDVAAVYAACDLVLLTSDNEGMPLSLIETAAAGRPSVTTRVGSAPEVVVDGVTGYVCDLDDGALAAAVVRLADDARLREAMGSAARDDAVRRFSRARMVADMQVVYEDVVSVS
jgi:glycosyltransferase involved in cell wall biosynthesis